MDELDRSPSTPALEIVFDRCVPAILDEPDRYPNHISFIAADHADFHAMLERNLEERMAVAIVYPDGQEIVATPASVGVLGALRRLLARLDRGSNVVLDGADPAVALPSDYVVELRKPAVPADAP